MEDMYALYNTDLQRYCCYLVGGAPSHPDVQDLLGDTWLKIMEGSQYKGRHGATWLTWAKRIAHNTWASYATNPRRLTYPVDNIEQCVDRERHTISYLPDETKETLNMLSLGLTKKHLAVVYLKSLGFDGQSMADILGVDVNLIYSRLYYARRYIRRMAL